MKKVVDAAVTKAYGGQRKIAWMEIYAGEKANEVYGANTWLPDETLDAIRDFNVAIKGPLTTPVGGGIRSLNVALRNGQLKQFRSAKGLLRGLEASDLAETDAGAACAQLAGIGEALPGYGQLLERDRL